MRASQFLVDRVEALKNSIEFFNRGGSGQDAVQRRLIFLSQIDFWDFEMDSAIFAFDNFIKRQESWSSVKGILEGLEYNNIIVNNNTLLRQSFKDSSVEAPTADLNVLIDSWNYLVNSCNALLLPPKQVDSSIICGAASNKTLKSLNKFIKEKR